MRINTVFWALIAALATAALGLALLGASAFGKRRAPSRSTVTPWRIAVRTSCSGRRAGSW